VSHRWWFFVVFLVVCVVVLLVEMTQPKPPSPSSKSVLWKLKSRGIISLRGCQPFVLRTPRMRRRLSSSGRSPHFTMPRSTPSCFPPFQLQNLSSPRKDLLLHLSHPMPVSCCSPTMENDSRWSLLKPCGFFGGNWTYFTCQGKLSPGCQCDRVEGLLLAAREYDWR